MLVNVTVKLQSKESMAAGWLNVKAHVDIACFEACVRVSVVELVLNNGSVTVGAAGGAVVSVKSRFSTEFVRQLSALFVVLLLTGCDFFNFVVGTIRNADNAFGPRYNDSSTYHIWPNKALNALASPKATRLISPLAYLESSNLAWATCVDDNVLDVPSTYDGVVV
uniref:Uncharacterized protein n=1 Tax=Glossina palpalis gambiensis TaxID=67801 RepID=A0A1B0BFH2_9MUSC